jgi:signal transduction histidine kinase
VNAYAHGRHRRAESSFPGEPALSPVGGHSFGTGTGTGLGLLSRRPGKFWRLRPRTVRAKVVSLLMLPVVALMTLWGLATVAVVGDALTVNQVKVIDGQVRGPLDQTVAALRLERASVVRFLSPSATQTSNQPAPMPRSASTAVIVLGSQEATTDAAVAAVRSGIRSASVETTALPSLQSGISTLLTDLDGLRDLRDRVAAGQIPAIGAYDAYTTAIEDVGTVEGALAAVRSEHTASPTTVATAAVGLLAIVVSLLISVRIGRGLVGELVGLRNSALDLAGRRLPAAIGRLRAGQEIDVAAEAPLPAGRPGEDEVAQVAEALAVVQRAAIEAAVERAEVVSSVAGVFLNLARRSQALVHRQLTLLESMERRVDDPGDLEDLFRLDHLATRMRRHAEGLIILSGSAPGRGWRRPVPLMDVVRAAASEVEDFARVDVRRMPPVRVVGEAVADLTHLVAELVENATGFSPPYSRVLVRGTQESSDCVIEVEDRGLGMGGPALIDANRRIAEAQPGDLFDSDRLGLYVVSRLARRHGISVALRTSAQGGTIAVVVLPETALASMETDEIPESPAEPESPAVAEPRETVAVVGKSTGAEPPPRVVGENGLPHRVRQASLAAQLRVDDRDAGHADPADDSETPPRSPDSVRATMAALQQGWTRGRDPDPDPEEFP